MQWLIVAHGNAVWLDWRSVVCCCLFRKVCRYSGTWEVSEKSDAREAACGGRLRRSGARSRLPHFREEHHTITNSFSSPRFMITIPSQNHQDYVSIDMTEETLIGRLICSWYHSRTQAGRRERTSCRYDDWTVKIYVFPKSNYDRRAILETLVDTKKSTYGIYLFRTNGSTTSWEAPQLRNIDVDPISWQLELCS